MASLAAILFPPPEPTGWDEWMLQHLAHHQAINQGIKTTKGITPFQFQIYPFNPKDAQNWLEQHQQQHNVTNSILGIGGQDLSILDFNDRKSIDSWTYLHWIEHQAAGSILGMGI